MAIVVVGGHSRSIGKTSVVAGLIAGLPERRWTAIKITQYGHGICSSKGEPCDCVVEDELHPYSVTVEEDRSGNTDSSRYLVAGAERSYWVRTRQGMLAEAMPAVRSRITAAQDVIIESNSVLKFIQPDLYLTVLDPAVADFKASARNFLDRADAVILHEAPDARWNNVSLKPVATRPMFRITPPPYVTAEIVDWVRSELAARVLP